MKTKSGFNQTGLVDTEDVIVLFGNEGLVEMVVEIGEKVEYVL